MRILLELSTYGCKTYHSLARSIKEQFPDSRFGIVHGPVVALKFVREQTDIEYEVFAAEVSVSFEDAIDYDELRKFEENLPFGSLWRTISSDRGIGRAFLHGAVGYEHNSSHDREYILRHCTKLIKRIRKTFKEFKPDIFIPAIAMGGIGVTILEEVCKESGVLYLVPDTLRVKNYCAFSLTHQLLFPKIDDLAQRLIAGDVEECLSGAEKLYDELINDLHDPDYFDAKNARTRKVEFPGRLGKVKYAVFFAPIALLSEVTAILVALLTGNSSKSNSTLAVWRRIRNRLLAGLQKLRLTSPQFGTILAPTQKYIYFPLSGQPEYSNNILGTMWMDHHHLIETLAKSIPHDWVIYVKEHPGVLSDRIRPLNFYKQIERLPNVFLAPLYTPSHEIISNAEMVAVISGTSGWEAIWRNRPVIEFRTNLWSGLGLSRKCTDIDELSIAIHDEIIRTKEISLEERKRRIVCFLTAVLKLGFWATYPKPLFYVEPGTDEEYEVCGRELADGLIKHLGYLENEKDYSFGIH